MAQPLEYEQVTYNAPDGSQMGRASTDKIAFFGATPIIRPSVTQQATATTTALRADLNRLETALVNLGLIVVT